MNIVETIAQSLHAFLAAQSGGAARRFFRLDGFDDAVYAALLERLRAEGDTLAGQPLWVRTTAPLPGYKAYALEADKSATWYRNHVPPGCALVLIFNRPTSDAQSLKDVYPVTESLLATEGLEHLIRAAFATYQPSPEQIGVLREFLACLRPSPQLRDLAEFLRDLDAYLHTHPGATMETAIAESLPALGLFRCRELAEVLNTAKGDALLRNVQRAARLGSELLDDRQRDEYLTRLAEAEFDDDAAYGGLAAEEKRALLRRFLTEVITDRRELLAVLGLDWREVAPVLHKSRRKSRSEQMQALAAALQDALATQHIAPEDLPEAAQDMLTDLTAGDEPEDEAVERFLTDYGDSLPRATKNQLRRLRSIKKYQTTDFIAGVTYLGVEFLTVAREDLPAGATLSVRWEGRDVGAREAEALLAFRALYGGIERAMPGIRWELDDLWALAPESAPDEEESEGEREKVIKTNLPFRVTLTDGEGQALATAELIWHYRSDGPAAATLAHLQAEAQALSAQQGGGPLFQTLAPRLRIPVYNTCPAPNEVSDLDLSRPLSSLGAWYRDATDLGAGLRDALRRVTRPETFTVIDQALTRLEEAWAAFVEAASTRGLLAADLDALLSAYEGLLTTAAVHLQQGQEILHGFRWLVQAWMVGPETFDEWAVMPLLHPLKLHWHRARARRFADFLGALLAAEPAPIVDVRRFRQELTVTYSSAGYPALLALPGKDRRPTYFLPVHEMQGYELFRQEGLVGLAYGLDPDLVSDDESEQAAEVAATELARVVQDYIETYPFARDGLEIYLVQCRNGALPGLLVERLDKLARRRRWALRLEVVVHSADRGAPLYRRVGEWLKAHEEFVARPDGGYFPPVALRVLECGYDDLFRQVNDTDLVILPDVLAEKGQAVESEMRPASPNADENDWPLYRAQQAPFERGEFTRALLLTPQPQPALLQQFYRLQWAAQERKPLPADQTPHFFQRVSLLDWEQPLTELHRRFNWVACYDTTVDRFLLEATFPETIEVIRYSLGLGAKRRHNLTVSSSYRARDIVASRLTANLESLLPGTPDTFRREVAQRLVAQAKQVSGDIVLRAAGPGAYLNELIGMVVAKHETERRYLAQHPGALTAWIYLDDFAHWFDGRIPDLLFVAIPPEANGELPLHVELLETKCVGESNFAVEAADAQKQVAQGVNRLAQAWTPGAKHLDAPYWYDQLYRAVVGNLALEHGQMRLWEAFRRRLPQGDFTLEIGGHTWIFCHDSSLGIAGLSDEGEAAVVAPDAPHVPHRYHHFGRVGLRRLLRGLVEAWDLPAPAETWAAAYDVPPQPPAPEPSVSLPPVVAPGAVEPSALPSPEAESALPSKPLAEWREQQARNLARALRDYGIQVYPIQPDEADVGPGVVRFKVRLRPGEKLSRLQAIAADLQRELALMAPPLIDNVRGTNFVGIDLPHPQPEILPLLPALAGLPPAPVGRLPFLVGKTPAGQVITADLADLPHLLVAGSTGSGKTIFLYSLLLSLIHRHGPQALTLLLIDPKQTDFVYFEGLPHLLGGQVVIEAEAAIGWLDQLTTETLETRSQRLRAARCRDIHDYNARHPDAPLAPLVVVIDEYADLVQVLDKSGRQEFERRLVRLAQRARNVGIHLVIATQRPSADIVTTSLKANLPARIAFRLPSHHDSMTILDQAGAENLLGRGDMLSVLSQGNVERLQGYYISPDELGLYSWA
ncbi:MAG TPA: DNA translocase FtsK [Anaerolineae bacterium]|nr:DNA translocase FtsK [Anaerolineae bacterium]HQK14972.1 DNA translocase FtsK [Anaerolineae bacterium]